MINCSNLNVIKVTQRQIKADSLSEYQLSSKLISHPNISKTNKSFHPLLNDQSIPVVILTKLYIKIEVIF